MTHLSRLIINRIHALQPQSYPQQQEHLSITPHLLRASFPHLLCPDEEPRPCEPCEETDAVDDSEEAAMGECEATSTSVW
jgi:hypothetical protein